MATTPYVRFFWSDWIADTSHLDLMQLGAYMRLLEHIYQHGRPLPGDLQRVFRICHATSSTEQETIRDILSEYFHAFEDPEHGLQWRHLRAEREIQWSAENHGEKKIGAAITNWMRWGDAKSRAILEGAGVPVPNRQSHSDSHSDSPATSSASRNQNQNQNQNQEGDKPPQPPLPKTRPDDVIPGGVDPQAWADFTAHRREIRKPLTDLSARKNAETLRTLSPAQQREAVNASIANRWTGVFPPKGKANGSAKTVSHEEFREMISRGDL